MGRDGRGWSRPANDANASDSHASARANHSRRRKERAPRRLGRTRQADCAAAVLWTPTAAVCAADAWQWRSATRRSVAATSWDC